MKTRTNLLMLSFMCSALLAASTFALVHPGASLLVAYLVHARNN